MDYMTLNISYPFNGTISSIFYDKSKNDGINAVKMSRLWKQK